MGLKLYEYDGKLLTKTEIARLIGVSDSTLSNYLKKTNDDIQLAIEQSLAGRKKFYGEQVMYKGEQISINQLAQKINCSSATLRKYYNEYHDINLAVKKSIEESSKRNVGIPYNGKIVNIYQIARENQIHAESLKREFKICGNIYEAIKKCINNKINRQNDIEKNLVEYNGEVISISKVAEKENIAVNTLKRYYYNYQNIYKAVMICKKKKNKEIIIDDVKTDTHTLSKYYDTSVSFVEKNIDNNNLDEYDKQVNKGKYMYDNMSLRKYCLLNSYNYSVILYLIQHHNMSVDDAVKEYKQNGQNVPITYVYKEFNILFRHLMLKYNVDSYKILEIMKENNCLFNEAIKKYVFTSNNQNEQFTQLEIDWMMDIYDFYSISNIDEIKKFDEQYYVSLKEKDFIIKKAEIIDRIKRQILLFEFSQVIDIWPKEELDEMMKLYELSDDEKKSIILDLYSPFENQIINPTEQYIKRTELLKKKVLDDDIEILDITELEKIEIQNKREKLEKIFDNNIRKK